MFKYKCISRGKILIYADQKIIEIYPGQEFELYQFINHPCIEEIKEEIKKKIKDAIKTSNS